MKAEIIALLDDSGSMNHLVQDTIGGFNRFKKEQQEVPGEARLTLALFSDSYRKLFSGIDIQVAPDLSTREYKPGGGTALLDALGRLLKEEGDRILSEGWADTVICCVITDGEENSSRETTIEQVRALTKGCEDKGWTFIYLGANQDAFSVARGMGMSGQTVIFEANSVGTQSMYSSTSASVRSARGGTKAP